MVRCSEQKTQTYVVDERHTFDMQVFPVKGVLKQFNDVIADGVFGSETFGPCEDHTFVKSGLFDREGECESERNGSSV